MRIDPEILVCDRCCLNKLSELLDRALPSGLFFQVIPKDNGARYEARGYEPCNSAIRPYSTLHDLDTGKYHCPASRPTFPWKSLSPCLPSLSPPSFSLSLFVDERAMIREIPRYLNSPSGRGDIILRRMDNAPFRSGSFGHQLPTQTKLRRASTSSGSKHRRSPW